MLYAYALLRSNVNVIRFCSSSIEAAIKRRLTAWRRSCLSCNWMCQWTETTTSARPTYPKIPFIFFSPISSLSSFRWNFFFIQAANIHEKKAHIWKNCVANSFISIMKPIIERMKWKNENCVYCIVSSIPCWLRTLSGRNERAQRKNKQQHYSKECKKLVRMAKGKKESTSAVAESGRHMEQCRRGKKGMENHVWP